MNVEGIVYMVEVEDGLTPKQWKKMLSVCETQEQEEWIPIEVSENNTSMYGFIKNDIYDNKEEIVKELELICDDWSREPENGLLELNFNDGNVRIKILCDYETVIVE